MKYIMIMLSLFIVSSCDRLGREAGSNDDLNFERQEEYDETDFKDRPIDTKDAPWPNGEIDD
jgi:hypothetical protein